MAIVIETPRLLLRRPEISDAEGIAAGIGDFEVVRWLPRVPHPYSIADAISWLATVPARPMVARANFAITLKGVEGYVGTMGIVERLGYWLARPFWGRGIATEAARAIVEWYFASGGAEPLRSGILSGNVASLRVQEKLGFVVSGSGTVPSLALARDIELIETVLTHDRFVAACRNLEGA